MGTHRVTISATIQAVAEAVKALFAFLTTAEGQATVRAWRESSEVWNSTVAKAGAWIEGLFRAR